MYSKGLHIAGIPKSRSAPPTLFPSPTPNC